MKNSMVIWCDMLSILVLSWIHCTRSTDSFHNRESTGTCDLFASYTSSLDRHVSQYCYRCKNVTNPYYLKRCLNPNCRDRKFDITENGVLQHYQCHRSCNGRPLACRVLPSYTNVEWVCSEDLEQDLTPRRFLVCQTCHSLCSHGYQEKKKITTSCGKINATHIGWNTTDLQPICISITKICGTPGISGVAVEDCVIHRDLDPTTDQYVIHQECRATCGPNLYQVYNVSTRCGEDGSWSQLDNLRKMCIDPSRGCELQEGAWNCTGVVFNSSHVSSGTICHRECGDHRSYDNPLMCNNGRWEKFFDNLLTPFCYHKTEDATESQGFYPVILIISIIGIVSCILCYLKFCGGTNHLQRLCTNVYKISRQMYHRLGPQGQAICSGEEYTKVENSNSFTSAASSVISRSSSVISRSSSVISRSSSVMSRSSVQPQEDDVRLQPQEDAVQPQDAVAMVSNSTNQRPLAAVLPMPVRISPVHAGQGSHSNSTEQVPSAVLNLSVQGELAQGPVSDIGSEYLYDDYLDRVLLDPSGLDSLNRSLGRRSFDE